MRRQLAIAPMLLSVVVLIASPPIQAEASNALSKEMTAGDLQKLCTSPDIQGKSACRFYILGVTQGIDLGMGIADGKTKGGRPCVPPETPGEVLELAVKMKLGADLTVFPDDRNLAAAGVIGAIIVSTFPCRKSN